MEPTTGSIVYSFKETVKAVRHVGADAHNPSKDWWAIEVAGWVLHDFYQPTIKPGDRVRITITKEPDIAQPSIAP